MQNAHIACNGENLLLVVPCISEREGTVLDLFISCISSMIALISGCVNNRTSFSLQVHLVLPSHFFLEITWRASLVSGLGCQSYFLVGKQVHIETFQVIHFYETLIGPMALVLHTVSG